MYNRNREMRREQNFMQKLYWSALSKLFHSLKFSRCQNPRTWIYLEFFIFQRALSTLSTFICIFTNFDLFARTENEENFMLTSLCA